MLEPLFNKEREVTIKKRATQMFSCEYCGIFKITCFEEHLRTDTAIRYYFDTINLKRSGFGTSYSSKILVSDKNIKIISKIVKIKKIIYNSHVMFMHCFTTKSRSFTKILKVEICVF